MNPRLLLPLSLASLLLPVAGTAADKITYNDQVLPLLKNACLNCHNPDKKKAGLDLSTYQSALAGSDNGKVLQSGNPEASLLIKCVRQTEDPKMPPKGDKLTDAEIALLEKWIKGQLLESANGKVVAVSNNVEVAVVSLEKPSGPPPMPVGDFPLEPVVHEKATNALVALAGSPWAPLVAVGGQKQVILYQSDTLQPLGILPFPEGFPTVIHFSRNGQLLMTGGGLGGKSGKVVLWNVETGSRVGEVGNEFDQVLAADLSPDQTHVALGGPTKILKIYSTKDGKLEQSIKKHTDWITAIAYSPDGKFLASADRSGGIVVWEGSTGKEFNTLPGHKLAVTSLAFMPGVLASGSEDGKISLWDVKEGKEIRSWNAHGGGVESVDFTPDGKIVSSGRDKVAKVWDQNGKTLLTTAQFDDIALRAVLVDNRVIAGDWTGQIHVFNFPDSKRVGDLSSNPPTIEETLVGIQKRLEEAKAKLPQLQQAQSAAEAQLKAAQTEAANQKSKQIAALENDRGQAQKELEAAGEGDKTALQKKAEEAVQKVKAAQDAPIPPLNPALEQAVAAAQKALQPAVAEVASVTAEQQRWQRAQAFMGVHRARQNLTELNNRFAGLTAAAKDAWEPAEKAQADVTDAEKSAAAAGQAAQAREGERAKAQADLDGAKKAVAAAEQAAQEKTAARQTAGTALERITAQVASLSGSLEKKKAEVANLDKAANALPAGSAERGAADAGLTGPRAEQTKMEADLAASQAELAAAKSGVEKAGQEVTAANAALNQPRETAKAAEAKLTAAAAAVAAAQKAVQESTAKLAEARQKLPAIIAEAKSSKTKAEQEAAAAGQELEAAKAQTERVRAEYDSHYPPAKPLAKS